MEKIKVDANAIALEKFGLKVESKGQSWIEYTDSIKTLFVDADSFQYYFNSSERMAPVTPDIVSLVDIIREWELKVDPVYKIFID